MIVLLILIIGSIIVGILKKENTLLEKEINLDSYSSMICNKNYTILIDSKERNESVIECNDTKDLYYVKHHSGEVYETYPTFYAFGYENYEIIEKYFPNGIYLYKTPYLTHDSVEFKILLEAQNEKELIDKYGEKLYDLAKEIFIKDRHLELIVYYNKSINDMNSSYNKLFLLANYWDKGFSQYADCTTFDDNVFCNGFPKDIINDVFSEFNKIPVDMVEALENNNHINITIKDELDDLNTFLSRLENGFKNHLYLYR